MLYVSELPEIELLELSNLKFLLELEFQFKPELVNHWAHRGPITDKFSLLVLRQDLPQTRMSKSK